MASKIPIEYKFLNIYLTPKWDPNTYYYPSQSEPESNGNEGYSTLPRSPELEPCHQMQLSVITKTTLFIWLGKSFIFFAGDTVSNSNLCWQGKCSLIVIIFK